MRINGLINEFRVDMKFEKLLEIYSVYVFWGW